MEELEKNNNKNSDILKNFWRLIKLSWPKNYKTLLPFFIVTISVTFFGFLQQGMLALVINSVTGDKKELIDFSQNTLIILFLISSLLINYIYSLSSFLNKVSWRDLYNFWEIEMLGKRISLDIGVYENPKFQDLLNKLEEKGMWAIANLISNTGTVLQNIVQVILSVGVLVFVEPLIASAVIGAYSPVLFVKLFYSKEVYGLWDAEGVSRRTFWDRRHLITDKNQLSELILFRNASYIKNVTSEIINKFNIKQYGVDKKSLYIECLALIISSFITGGCILWLLLETFKGNIAIGTFTFLIGSIFSLQTALGSFFTTISSQYENALFVNDFFKFYDTESMIVSDINAIDIDVTRTPHIEFKNVTFKYPGTEKKIIEDFNFTIEPGEKIAIVGVNGAGKTTLMRLLTRIYDPTEGAILINGNDLRNINLDQWRQIVAVLFQDFTTYHFNVTDSIKMGNKNIEGDDKELFNKVLNASIESESDEFIKEWDKKYEQQIGREFDGIDPSKGQNQKLALARTFYKTSKVIVLDEPTASIDAESEQRIFDKLEEGPADRTTILISHRFSTVRNAHKIIVIKGGKIIEMGTHRLLLEQNATYARLFEMQAKGYK